MLNNLPGDSYSEPLNQLESELLQQLLDEHIEADEVRSLLGKEVSILDAKDMEGLKKLKSTGSRALAMKNQLKHTIATGKNKNPGFFGPLEDALKKLLEDEKDKRIDQAEFLKQLAIFTEQIRSKDAGAKEAGFDTPGKVAVFDYLKVEVSEASASQWTQSLFDDDVISTVLSSPIWKRKKEIHKALQKQIRKRMRALAGWDMKTARQHAATLFDILLNN